MHVSDYGKMMKVLIDTVILVLSELLFFLLEYEYLPAGSRLVFIMLILLILGGPICLIAQIWNFLNKI